MSDQIPPDDTPVELRMRRATDKGVGSDLSARADMLTARAEGLESAMLALAESQRAQADAQRELAAVDEKHGKRLREIVIILCFDLLITLGIGNAFTAQCDGRNADARRQHNLWKPILATATNPEAQKFKGTLDVVYPQIDCSILAVTKRSFIHHPSK